MYAQITVVSAPLPSNKTFTAHEVIHHGAMRVLVGKMVVCQGNNAGPAIRAIRTWWSKFSLFLNALRSPGSLQRGKEIASNQKQAGFGISAR